MKIVCDDKIPFIQPALRELADELVVKAGAEIGPDDVHDATILVVRTRTRCDRHLLEGSSVRLVVTATIGYDHLDTEWLSAAGIQWTNCPGCNATSVAQYVGSCLLLLQQQRGMLLGETTVGIIGVGHVGTAVALRLEEMGIKEILLYDPFRQEAGELPPEGLVWNSLEQVLEGSQVITLHTPLTLDGSHPTHHLVDDTFLSHMRPHSVLINAARGGVADERAVLKALDSERLAEAIIDTWEGEPLINTELLQKAFIGTPHIAGYSSDGKANATRMSLSAICRFLGRPMTFTIQPPALPAGLVLSSHPEERAMQLYDPRRDSEALKNNPTSFEWLRGHYPLRRE